ncbi:MAG: hypothetical protein ACRYG4_11615 [Janthinobacterium lividum]
MIDPDHVAALLHASARAGESVTYSEVLNALGFGFSRPKMRALCVVLMDVDAAERGAGRPDLAVLVVRQSDRLPGQGWWLGRSDYKGLFVGAEAVAYVAKQQRGVFEFWAKDPPPLQGEGDHRPCDGGGAVERARSLSSLDRPSTTPRGAVPLPGDGEDLD